MGLRVCQVARDVYGHPAVVALASLMSRVVVDETTHCWVWTGGVRSKSRGYGGIRAFGRPWPVHLLSWTLLNGPVEPGQVVAHGCGNRLCVRPSHLVCGTRSEVYRQLNRTL